VVDENVYDEVLLEHDELCEVGRILLNSLLMKLLVLKQKLLPEVMAGTCRFPNTVVFPMGGHTTER
jgi:hypothetical protein